MNEIDRLNARIAALEGTLQAISRIVAHSQTECKELSSSGNGAPHDLPAVKIVPTVGNSFKFLQALHAMYKAGWFKRVDGKATSFKDVVQAFLTDDKKASVYYNQCLQKAYNQNNWHEFVEAIDFVAALERKSRVH